MIARFSTFLALAFLTFLMIGTPASAAPCGKGGGNGSDKNSRACPPNKHGVPGPIAGVGLPFLIVGMIAYRRRRKTGSDEAE